MARRSICREPDFQQRQDCFTGPRRTITGERSRVTIAEYGKARSAPDISIYSRLDSYLHTLAGDLMVESYCESFL